MKLNVVYNKRIQNFKKVSDKIESILSNKGIDYKLFDIDSMKEYGDFTLTIGGDGTLLKVAKSYSVPVLGINMGRLGFLSQAVENELDLITDKIINKEYTVEERLTITYKNHTALNDFVIKGCSHSRTSKLYLSINGKQVCDYIADGLIVSTPTGSTAYCLSAGGPVLYPSMDSIVIVPICPHTLSSRPLVIPSSEIITVQTGDKPLSISVDGFELSECDSDITIRKSLHKAKLAFISNDSFYTVLRNKLHWGIPPEYNA